MSKISDEKINQIPILYNKLGTKKAVAQELGISAATVSKYLTILNGASSVSDDVQKKGRTKITDELIQKINDEYRICCNMSRVARQFGISPTTVRKYLTEENAKLNQTQYDDRDALWYYIYRLFGKYSDEKPVSDWNIVQMNKFKTQGISYAAQLLTLKYFFEIRKNSVEKSNGSIGIIPYVFSESMAYYRKEDKKQKEMEKLIKEQLERDRIEIKYKPQDYFFKKKKQINLDKIGDD